MFYDNYVKLCAEHGEKPTPVAQKLGCTSSNVAMWKKGSVPRAEVLSKIAEYFGVTSQYLLYGDDPEIKKDTTPKSGVDAELVDIWNTASEDERRVLLEMARMLKNRRNG